MNPNITDTVRELLNKPGDTTVITKQTLQKIYEHLDPTITVQDSDGNTIATIENETAETLTHEAVNTYIYNLLINSIEETPQERLHTIAKYGYGTLTTKQATQLIQHINDLTTALNICRQSNQQLRKPPTQTITMGNKPHNIYPQDTQ